MSEARVRRSWDVTKRTADSLNKLQLISGVDKSELVDISINLLFQTVMTVRACTHRPSREIIESLASTFPADLRCSDIQVESGPLRIDLSQLLQVITGDSSMTFDPSYLYEESEKQTTLSAFADDTGGDRP